MVCKFKKSIYELKKTSRQWYLKFNDIVLVKKSYFYLTRTKWEKLFFYLPLLEKFDATTLKVSFIFIELIFNYLGFIFLKERAYRLLHSTTLRSCKLRVFRESFLDFGRSESKWEYGPSNVLRTHPQATCTWLFVA